MKRPLPDFWVTVHVILDQPLSNDQGGESENAVGYYRVVGICGLEESIRTRLEQYISDGTIDWDETEWHPINAAELDQGVRKRAVFEGKEGIWYESGRMFYTQS